VSWVAAVLAAVACAGWGVAVVLFASMRRRFSLVADAEHELRGAAAAIGLAAERVSRTGAMVAFSSLVRLQLDRMGAGLEDLAAAQAPRRAARGGSLGDGEMDAGRLAQVLGNLVANATEHGVGSVDVSTSRPAGAVRIEIRNRNRPRELDDARTARTGGRGRGLAIAERAARELGGRLSVESREGETRAELELPAREAGSADSTATTPRTDSPVATPRTDSTVATPRTDSTATTPRTDSTATTPRTDSTVTAAGARAPRAT
jgi:two-component system, OmpR family, sensor histidine kinase SenX3